MRKPKNNRTFSRQAAVKVIVQVNGKHLSLNAHGGWHGRFRLKVGRSWSKKHEFVTTTELFDIARRWVSKEIRA